MSLIKIILRLIRRGLRWLLLIYWATFIGYRVAKVIVGGPSAVVGYYRRIFYMHAGMAQVAERSSWVFWGPFLAAQVIYLGIALLLCFEWKSSRDWK